MCLKFIDSEKEREIYVGTSWPFDKLGPGECVIPKKFKKKDYMNPLNKGVKVG